MSNTIKNNRGYFLVATLMVLLASTLAATGLIYYLLTYGARVGSGEVRRIEELSLVDSCLNGAIARMTEKNSILYQALEKTPSSGQWRAQFNDYKISDLFSDSLQYRSAMTSKDTGVGGFAADTGLAYGITLSYKAGPGGSGIYYYVHSAQKETLMAGPAFRQPDQLSSPVYLALITGTAGTARRSIEVSLIQEPETKGKRSLKQVSWREIKTD